MRALLACALVVAGCGGASTDPGFDALLRVQRAQFVPGAVPDESDGPMVLALNNDANLIRPGMISKPLSGLVPRGTGAVAIYLEGDSGYWLLPPGAEDPTALNQLGFSTSLSFSPLLTAGTYQLSARAIDQAGHFGPPSTAMLTAMDDVTPMGMLVVTLKWVQNADLDLHLVTPDGTEIWAKRINSYTPPKPGDPPDPNGWMNGGILDFDSNANCIIDGRNQEDVYWTVAPPSGHYIARVDAFSLCGQYQADWTMSANLDGNELGRSFGTMHDPDTWAPHMLGAGVTALPFDVP